MKKFDLGRDLGITLSNRKPKEWSQDFVLESKVKDGVIIADDTKGKPHYIKILEISAVNFNIMSLDEQDRLIMNYMRLLRIGPDSFHIKIVTSKTNIDDYIAAAKKAFEKEENRGCKQYIANYINYLVKEASTQTFRRHYYFIFEYEAPRYGKAATTEEEVIEALNKKAADLASGFDRLGNKVTVRTVKEENSFLNNLIYDYYNRRICKTENFNSRVKRIMDDSYKINKADGNTSRPDADFKTLYAPKSIDFNESPNYMVIGGLYRTHFFIPGDRIPRSVYAGGGWLTELMSLGEGFDLDLYFKKGDNTQKLNSVGNNLKFSRYNMENTEAEQQNADDVMQQYSDAMFIKSALKGGEDIYEMSILLTTYAYTLEELDQRRDFIKNRSVAMDMPIFECRRFQEEAFFSTGLTMELTSKMYNLTHRNITSSGVAAIYPFTAFELRDPNGVAIGYNRSNRSLVILDPHDKRYTNSNFAIYGASGHGKTFSLMTLTSRLRFLGEQIFILAPEKQHEFLAPCLAFGGEFIDLSPSSKQRINLFDVRPIVSPERALLGDAQYFDKSWLIDKIDDIKIWANYLISDLTLAEKVVLEKLLLQMYADFGITEDNDSIFKDESKTELKPMPIMSDFYERVLNEPGIRPDIATILSQFVTGAAKNMNGQTNVDLTNKYIVFGLESIKEELLAPSMFIILNYVWGKCREDRTKRKMIAIDEVWKLLDEKNPLVGSFIQQIFKLIRGYGGGAIAATQSIDDLFSIENNFGNAILSCSHSKIILGMEQRDLARISQELGLSATEAASIISAPKGEALLCAGTNHIPIKIEASENEFTLFDTNPEGVAKRLEEAGQLKY